MSGLSEEELQIYEWQMWIAGFGAKGQSALKDASVLVSRCGGVGGAVAYYLAAAGVGRLILAHAGSIKPSDLNRQILMTHANLGCSRIETAAQRLRELNPHIRIEAVAENISEANAERLVKMADMTVDCAPLFSERYLMNRESVRAKKPLIECAMYEMDAQITSIVPGKTPCLACLYPQAPPAWKRQFPVLGAVAGMIGTLGAIEAIKMIAGIGDPLFGRMLLCNLREMQFRTVKIARNENCAVCGEITPGPPAPA